MGCLCLGAYAHNGIRYSVFVCLSEDCYSCSMIKIFYRLLYIVMFSWISILFVDLQNKVEMQNNALFSSYNMDCFALIL